MCAGPGRNMAVNPDPQLAESSCLPFGSLCNKVGKCSCKNTGKTPNCKIGWTPQCKNKTTNAQIQGQKELGLSVPWFVVWNCNGFHYVLQFIDLYYAFIIRKVEKSGVGKRKLPNLLVSLSLWHGLESEKTHIFYCCPHKGRNICGGVESLF